MKINNLVKVLRLRVGNVVMIGGHLHPALAQGVGDALDHQAGLVHLVDVARGAADILAVAGRDDDPHGANPPSSRTRNSPAPAGAVPATSSATANSRSSGWITGRSRVPDRNLTKPVVSRIPMMPVPAITRNISSVPSGWKMSLYIIP